VKILESLSSLIPFLEPYPSWVKVLFSTWVILTATFFISLILAKPSTAPVPEPRDKIGTTPNSPNQEETGNQRIWLIIEGVDAYGIGNPPVKVIANVNGTKYVYPTLDGIEWMEVRSSMASQKFLLPIADKYEISFSMKMRNGHQVTDFVSVNSVTVNASDAKSFNSQYNLYSKSGLTRSGSVSASVRFKLSQNPN
jgi:hypothetical protein